MKQPLPSPAADGAGRPRERRPAALRRRGAVRRGEAQGRWCLARRRLAVGGRAPLRQRRGPSRVAGRDGAGHRGAAPRRAGRGAVCLLHAPCRRRKGVAVPKIPRLPRLACDCRWMVPREASAFAGQFRS